MESTPRRLLIPCVAGMLLSSAAFATNPLITDQFTADPTARVFDGKIYVYPSHDIREPPGYQGRPQWFVMEDYHVFSSDDLTNWKDHGVIVTRNDVPWADQTKYAMPGTDWSIASSAAKKIPAGAHDLYVTMSGAEPIEVDWVSFR